MFNEDFQIGLRFIMPWMGLVPLGLGNNIEGHLHLEQLAGKIRHPSIVRVGKIRQCSGLIWAPGCICGVVKINLLLQSRASGTWHFAYRHQHLQGRRGHVPFEGVIRDYYLFTKKKVPLTLFCNQIDLNLVGMLGGPFNIL